MSLHLQRQIGKLKDMILKVGTLVEEAVEGAIRSVQTRDAQLARRIVDGDSEVDRMELEVEEECLHTLALHQPVAFDLRFVVAVLKINNDLERIADLASNIAEQAVFLAGFPRGEPLPSDLGGMARLVQGMLKRSLDALVNIDTDAAESVRASDDRVDAIHRQTYHLVETGIRADPSRTEELIHLISVSRNLERIGDHCVNIAEDVLYMARGDILRHSKLRER